VADLGVGPPGFIGTLLRPMLIAAWLAAVPLVARATMAAAAKCPHTLRGCFQKHALLCEVQ
jgi:hypothetical protein